MRKPIQPIVNISWDWSMAQCHISRLPFRPLEKSIRDPCLTKTRQFLLCYLGVGNWCNDGRDTQLSHSCLQLFFFSLYLWYFFYSPNTLLNIILQTFRCLFQTSWKRRYRSLISIIFFFPPTLQTILLIVTIRVNNLGYKQLRESIEERYNHISNKTTDTILFDT